MSDPSGVHRASPASDQAGEVRTSSGGFTTKVGFAIIAMGVLLVMARAAGWVDTEVADIASVLAIVVGALAVAIDGEEADESTKPKRRGA
jgi:hypothetical protein